MRGTHESSRIVGPLIASAFLAASAVHALEEPSSPVPDEEVPPPAAAQEVPTVPPEVPQVPLEEPPPDDWAARRAALWDGLKA